MRVLAATAVLLSLSSPAFAQPADPLARLLEMQKAAPEDNGLQLLLAKEYIRRGDRNAALVELKKAVESGIDVDPVHDHDWDGLRHMLAFGVLLKKARASAIEKWKGVEAFRIPISSLSRSTEGAGWQRRSIWRRPARIS